SAVRQRRRFLRPRGGLGGDRLDRHADGKGGAHPCPHRNAAERRGEPDPGPADCNDGDAHQRRAALRTASPVTGAGPACRKRHSWEVACSIAGRIWPGVPGWAPAWSSKAATSRSAGGGSRTLTALADQGFSKPSIIGGGSFPLSSPRRFARPGDRLQGNLLKVVGCFVGAQIDYSRVGHFPTRVGPRPTVIRRPVDDG